MTTVLILINKTEFAQRIICNSRCLQSHKPRVFSVLKDKIRSLETKQSIVGVETALGPEPKHILTRLCREIAFPYIGRSCW